MNNEEVAVLSPGDQFVTMTASGVAASFSIDANGSPVLDPGQNHKPQGGSEVWEYVTINDIDRRRTEDRSMAARWYSQGYPIAGRPVGSDDSEWGLIRFKAGEAGVL